MDDESLERRLAKLYYEPHRSSALAGKRQLFRHIPKDKRDKAIEWLMGEDAYTLHKPAVSKFQRRPTIVSGLGEQLQADLMDISSRREENDNFKFVLTVVDVFSKIAWAEPVRSKSGADVSVALRRVLERSGRFRKLQTDKGKEFYNREVKAVLKENKIKHFSTEDERRGLTARSATRYTGT